MQERHFWQTYISHHKLDCLNILDDQTRVYNYRDFIDEYCINKHDCLDIKTDNLDIKRDNLDIKRDKHDIKTVNVETQHVEVTWGDSPRYGEKMWPENQLFGFHSACMEFFTDKTYKQDLVPHFPQRRFNILFHRYLGVCFFVLFFLKIVWWKIFKISFPTKKVISIFVTRRPLPLKTAISSTRRFFTFFSENIAFLKLRLNICSLCA